MVWGVSAPWTLVAGAMLGLWVIVSPALFGTTGGGADSDRLAGALVLTVSVVAMAEVARAGRLLNVPLGLWIATAPWLLGGFSAVGAASDAVAGLAVAALALPRGRATERYAGWDRWVI